ncbi:MAG: hypothetical protein GF320_14250 [Armatimonadia bacterium]|nr:hypothetical protein [Armatimonadia bacterium]
MTLLWTIWGVGACFMLLTRVFDLALEERSRRWTVKGWVLVLAFALIGSVFWPVILAAMVLFGLALLVAAIGARVGKVVTEWEPPMA